MLVEKSLPHSYHLFMSIHYLFLCDINTSLIPAIEQQTHLPSVKAELQSHSKCALLIKINLDIKLTK